MEEKEFKYLLKKYLKGEASQSEIDRIEKFENEINRTSENIEQEILAKTQDRIYRKIEDRLFIKNQYWIKMAASFLILVGLGALGLWFGDENTRTIGNNSTKIKHIELIDGTKIILNQGSQISFNESDFNRDLREISLDGEAFFEVTKNEHKPFIVKSDDVFTKVLGTSFNIESEPNHTLVTVVSGKVKVTNSKSKDELFLVPNEQAISKASGTLTKGRTNSDLFTSWWKEKTYLENITSTQFLEFLAAEYNVDIPTLDEKLRSEKLSIMVHRSDDLEALLKRFNYISQLQLTKNDKNEIKLTK